MDTYTRMTPETLTRNYRWSLFENTLRDPSPAMSLIIFQDRRYYNAFMAAFICIPTHMHEGTVIDLTPFGDFSPNSHMWGNASTERLATSRSTGTKFICLMAEQEASYREHVLPSRPEPTCRLAFSGAYPHEVDENLQGTPVRVVSLEPADGMMELYTDHIGNRRVGATGTIVERIPRMGPRDIWLVREENGKLGAYYITELAPIEP